MSKFDCLVVISFFSAGITNVEEFSLLVEGQKEDKEDADKMGTMKRVTMLYCELWLSFTIHTAKTRIMRNMQCIVNHVDSDSSD